MLLTVTEARHVGSYRLLVEFNDHTEATVDLKDAIFNDHREIFRPLRDIDYFKRFEIRLNTVCWPNEADFAPEFLRELASSEYAGAPTDPGLRHAAGG